MSDFEFDQPKQRGTNLHAKSECVVCGGDKFVVVAIRPAKQSPWMEARKLVPSSDIGFEEYAPCPACHAGVDTKFFRYDGTPVRSPDPALVRQRALPVPQRSGVRISAPASAPPEVIEWMRANGIPVKA